LALEGHDSLDVATSYNNVAIVYEAQGKYEEALEMHAKSLDIRTRILGGDNHLRVADSYQNLAGLYQSQGNQVQTTEMATKAYHIYLKVLGPDHPSTRDLKPFVK